MKPMLEAFSLKGYRSLSREVQYFGGLSKINVIIGQNNSGKSNVTRFLAFHLPQLLEALRKGQRYDGLSDLDKPLGAGDEERLEFGIGVMKGGPLWKATIKRLRLMRQEPKRLEKNLLGPIRSADSDQLWFDYQLSESSGQYELSAETFRRFEKFSKPETNWVWSYRAVFDKEGDKNLWVRSTVNAFSPIHVLTPVVDLIPAIRTIEGHERANRSKDSEGTWHLHGHRDHSGIGIIDDLFSLQNPTVGADDDLVRFKKINEFVGDITGNNAARISVPHDKSAIIVTIDGKRLPLSSLGTGIEEVLILAVKSTIFDDQIVCVEEPELHLHPTLQKKLIQYLNTDTDNQYFITTHSAHLVDAAPSSVYHVRVEDGISKVDAAITDSEKFRICSDLGYKASDLLQANCIVWVEGPTDRIYLNHWLHAVASDIVEGIHYSIMFYGGRLLSHLSADDTEVEEFVSLQRLNRNIVMVMDSDRSKSKERLNDTKLRVRKEIEKIYGLVWVTAGREIENYFGRELWEEAVRAAHPRAKKLLKYGRYERITRLPASTGAKPREIDKLKVAHYLTSKDADLTVLGLNKSVSDLVKFVRKANG